jgi:hypothetical protein
MKIRRVIRKQIAHDEDGISLAGAIDAAISANVNEPGKTTTRVSSRQRIVQRANAATERPSARDDGRDLDSDEGGRNG